MRVSQQIAGLTWGFCLPAASEEQIDGLESQLGVVFPALFRQVLRLCQAGKPLERNCFAYPHPHVAGSESCLAAVPAVERIPRVIQGLARDDQLPAGLIPFAEDGGGDFMCLDFRASSPQPRVAYWMHEEDRDESAVAIADSFEEFLAMLTPFDEEAFDSLHR